MTAPAHRADGSRWAGMALVLGGATCWSLGGVLIRLTDGIDIWQIVFYRSLVMLVVVGVWIWSVHGNQSFAIVHRAGWTAAIAGIATGLAGLAFVGRCSIPRWRRPS